MKVERCFAFVDLTGFTAYTERNGDEQTVAMLATFRGWVRQIAARRGVRVTKWLGDGAMLSSADTAAVVGLVLELESKLPGALPLGLRAGMAHGAVIMFEGDDYIGRPANVAARLCDAAADGEVLATREVAGRAPRWVECGASRPYVLQGMDRPVDAFRLTLATGAVLAADPCCGMRLLVSAGLETRFGADESIERFCSTACAVAWEESQRRPPPVSDPTPAPAV